uniref:C-type lectin domain-containing protein n=1 Tax=Panagrolaimus davidi TaxID=227884 RepID=A0A914P072_9BILA
MHNLIINNDINGDAKEISENFTPITGTWSEVANYCSKVGNGLVTIHSKYENDIVTEVASPALPPNEMNITIAWVFIGLNRFNDGKYYWNDGSVLNYTNWNPFQPNSDAPFVGLNPKGGRIEITGTEHADEFVKGMWDDLRPNHGPNGTGPQVSIAGICQKPFY